MPIQRSNSGYVICGIQRPYDGPLFRLTHYEINASPQRGRVELRFESESDVSEFLEFSRVEENLSPSEYKKELIIYDGVSNISHILYGCFPVEMSEDNNMITLNYDHREIQISTENNKSTKNLIKCYLRDKNLNRLGI